MTRPSEDAVEALRRVAGSTHAVTIGNFDGVHRGHVYLINQVVEAAEARGVRSLVITFEPHPTAVLRPDVPFTRLSTPEEKVRLIRETGVDDIAVIPFDRKFASLMPGEFLELMTREAHPVAVFVGEGFRFGRGRAGDGETIRHFGETHGFDTAVVPRLRDDGTIISSSSIRAALTDGDVTLAARLLGRRYRLKGVVEHGAARGRELGFPTANLLLPDDLCVPCDGIYAGYAHVSGTDRHSQPAMIYIGTRPTFDGTGRHVEVNILDFNDDLYARDLEVEFVAFVRGDAIFDSPEALTEQMRRDEAATRRILGETTPEDADPRTTQRVPDGR